MVELRGPFALAAEIVDTVVYVSTVGGVSLLSRSDTYNNNQTVRRDKRGRKRVYESAENYDAGISWRDDIAS